MKQYKHNKRNMSTDCTRNDVFPKHLPKIGQHSERAGKPLAMLIEEIKMNIFAFAGKILSICCSLGAIALGIGTLGYNPLNLPSLSAEEGALGTVAGFALALLIELVHKIKGGCDEG